jgi:hypothetical protein
VRAGALRFRPVLLTAVTTILGLLPLTLGLNIDFFNFTVEYGAESSQWWGAMGVAVIAGLTVATVLTLVVVPRDVSHAGRVRRPGGFCLDVAEGESPQLPRQSHWVLAGSRRVPLRPGENVIGRDPACGVWIDSASVSRRHARILIDAAGAVLDDLGSKNGTLVNGLPLTGTVPLQSGDRIHVGSVLLIYRSSGSGMSTETQVDQPRARS